MYSLVEYLYYVQCTNYMYCKLANMHLKTLHKLRFVTGPLSFIMMHSQNLSSSASRKKNAMATV